MPEMNKHDRGRGAHFDRARNRPVRLPYDDYPPIPMPDQSRYGTATTDPLGREGPGWHKGKQSGLPTKTKGDSK